MKLARLVLLILACAAAGAADWPQVGGNPQHTNSTPDSPAPPYKVAWVADFSPELVYSAQPVIAAGRLFQTTLNGSLYALDVATGKRLWHFPAGTCVWGSAAVETAADGTASRVFVVTWDGLLYGLDAAAGKQLWHLDTEEPISGSPCVAEGTIFLGTRKGNLLAIGTDGTKKWKQPLSWHIYSTAAWDAGKVFVVTEDMFVHCVDGKTGKPLWKSQRIYGLLFREFYPVVHKGRVFVSVTPSEWRGGIDVAPFVWDPGKALMDKCSAPLDPKQPSAAAARRSLIRGKKLPEELEEGQQKLVQFYEENPHLQTLYVLNAADGKQPYNAVHQYGSAGLQQVIMPPAVCADGTLVVYCTMGGARLARFDPVTNRWTDILFEVGGTATDESEFDSVGGLRVFSKNTMRANAVLDLASGQVTTLAATGMIPMRVSAVPAHWGPAVGFSPDRLSSPWHGAPVGMSPMPIAGNRVFWMRQNQRLVAYEGVSP
ncbi:MAG: PQQ-binding-like beta-propeller repeat protein [Thermoguttaceae bacterium]